LSKKIKTSRPMTRVVVAAVSALGLLALGSLFLAPTANAATVSYSGDLTSGTITINSTSANPTVLTNPVSHLNATIDDSTGALGATATFADIYTPTFDGPFGLIFYAKAVITQVGAGTGTVVGNNVTADINATLAITVYNRVGASPDPSTDTKFTGPGCFVNVSFGFTGTLDLAAGTVNIADSQFTIPQFPADGDVAGANCWLATDELNNRLAGPNNSAVLAYGGSFTTTTTSTTTSIPPTSETTIPPTSETTIPPTSETTIPPTSETTIPPTSETTIPPTSETTIPPTSETTIPPTSETTIPPTSETTLPPTTIDPCVTPTTLDGSPVAPECTTTTVTVPPTSETTLPPTTAGPTTTAASSTTEAPTTVVPTSEETTTTVPSDIPEITLEQGETGNLSGTGCEPGGDVVVTLEGGTVLGTFTADENGDFVATITIPATLPVDQYLATATCAAPADRTKVRDAQFGGITSTGGVVKQFIRVNVTAATSGTDVTAAPVVPSTPSSGTSLPRTGTNSGPLTALGLAGLTLGAAFVYGSRRIRTAR